MSMKPLFFEGAMRKHVEAIASMEAQKPTIDWDAYAKVIKGDSDFISDMKVVIRRLT